ncbi:MAG: arsenate reductase ArsC [Chloroflexota bacterium]
MDRARVLFVCTHNSARSQMAEGLLRHVAGERFEAFSAGTEVSAVRPEAIRVMAELGIDISGQHSKSVDEFVGRQFAWVITVCDRARETCPYFPGAEQTAHWGFDDPAEAQGTDEERLLTFRHVRDEIRDRLRMFIPAASRTDLPAHAPTVLERQ